MIRLSASPIWYAALAALAVLGLAILAGAPLRKEAAAAAALERSPSPQPNGNRARTLIPVDVLRVIDGDTIEVRAHVWLDQTIVTRVRLKGIDAPEFRTSCLAEAAKAEDSRSRLVALTNEGRLHLTGINRDKYGGRVLGDLVTANGTSIAEAMLASGHARHYTGGKRQTWC